MSAFRDIRILPVVLIAMFGLAVLKIAGIFMDGGYMLDDRAAVDPKSPGRRKRSISRPANATSRRRHHRLGR